MLTPPSSMWGVGLSVCLSCQSRAAGPGGERGLGQEGPGRQGRAAGRQGGEGRLLTPHHQPPEGGLTELWWVVGWVQEQGRARLEEAEAAGREARRRAEQAEQVGRGGGGGQRADRQAGRQAVNQPREASIMGQRWGLLW